MKLFLRNHFSSLDVYRDFDMKTPLKQIGGVPCLLKRQYLIPSLGVLYLLCLLLPVSLGFTLTLLCILCGRQILTRNPLNTFPLT